MRLIVVKQTGHSESLGFSEFHLSFPKSTIIEEGWSHKRLPLDLKTHDGTKLPSIHARASKLALSCGIILAGHELEGDEILAFFFNTGGPVEFEAGEAVATCQLIDPVSMRQHVEPKAVPVQKPIKPKKKR